MPNSEFSGSEFSGSEFSGSGFLTDRVPVCPPDLLAKARVVRPEPLRLAMVRSSARLPLETAKHAYEAGIAVPILIGEGDKIEAEAEAIGFDLGGIAVHETHGEKAAIEAATALVRGGEAEALMKGHIHSDVFMGGLVSRKAEIRGTGRMVHIFVMFPPERDGMQGRPLLISDAAVNVAPDMKTHQQALVSLADTARALGISVPKIAIISATETPIASVPSSLAARTLSDWAGEHITDAVVSGPLSLDLALAPEAVAIKGMSGDVVAGQADALLMPDIVSGNVLFKSLVWHNGACAAGVVVGGRVPIILTSRADPLAARMASIAVAALC